jgi:hypothetical protein
VKEEPDRRNVEHLTTQDLVEKEELRECFDSIYSEWIRCLSINPAQFRQTVESVCSPNRS